MSEPKKFATANPFPETLRRTRMAQPIRAMETLNADGLGDTRLDDLGYVD